MLGDRGGLTEKEERMEEVGSHHQEGVDASSQQNIYPVEISIQSLLKAGAHFGHQTDKWNPKMAKYIYGAKSGIHIINLDLTLKAWREARKAVVNATARGGSVLFVGTKRQARRIVEEESKRCGGYYVTSRWLGGTLTNFSTIKKSVDRMKKLNELLEKSQDENSDIKLNKKERLRITREITKLENSLGGIKDMRSLPSIVLVTDIRREEIAVREARKLHIPVIALVDTNCDPTIVDYPIPANDDGVKTLRLFCAAVADAALEGAEIYKASFVKQREQDKPADAPSVGDGTGENGNGSPEVAEASDKPEEAGKGESAEKALPAQ
ncbi:MAG: 30S ribosomal protein S2 [Candidatus Dadabacteria bacterium]|nr:MAG: 30S ribosomal protein S2 [Candidatus Dadabacteria bacterium]